MNTNLSQTFAYDFENRLTSWSSNGTTLNQTQSWNLSLEGAWNSTTVNGNTENRTFNQTYEILTSNANAMTHDRKGNLTTNKDGSLYTWDFNNQLAFSTAGTPSVNAAYAYDALGCRVSKSSGNTITVFVHTNYQIATEYKSINGGAFTENQSFVYAIYIDDPIALISTNGTYFYHSNQQYSISAITDSNGNLSERYGYNAYGKPVIITDSILVDNPYFFTGRQLDSETGLFYFRARYYDASLGQFISRDPLNYVDGMNLYRGYFAVNDLDPSGLSAHSDAGNGCNCGLILEEAQRTGESTIVTCLKLFACLNQSIVLYVARVIELGYYIEQAIDDPNGPSKKPGQTNAQAFQNHLKAAEDAHGSVEKCIRIIKRHCKCPEIDLLQQRLITDQISERLKALNEEYYNNTGGLVGTVANLLTTEQWQYVQYGAYGALAISSGAGLYIAGSALLTTGGVAIGGGLLLAN